MFNVRMLVITLAILIAVMVNAFVVTGNAMVNLTAKTAVTKRIATVN